MGLQEHSTGLVGTSRTPRDLQDGLQQPFGCAEISTEQALIRVDDTDQGDRRKMMSLGEHLRTDKKSCTILTDFGDGGGEGVAAMQGIAIYPPERCLWKVLADYLFQLLCALSGGDECVASTGRARLWPARFMTAMVAAETSMAVVPSH